jgi:PKD repeat protein
MKALGFGLLLIVFLLIFFAGCVNQTPSSEPTHTITATATPTTIPVPQQNGTNSAPPVTPVVTRSTGVTTHSLQRPVADFIANKTSGRVPLPVKFSDRSYLGPTNWSWDFGDGKSSNETNPVHAYLAPGTYTVKMTASNDAGSNMVRKTYYITVTPEFQAPVARFGTKPQEALSNTIQFVDLSDGPATNWSWNFGGVGTSNLQNPAYSFPGPGNYMVTLTVSNPLGRSTTMYEFLLGGGGGAQPSSVNTQGRNTQGSTYPVGDVSYQQNW